ncbi:MAG: hypothetical protein IKX39_03095 [Muribaculaceae bacterium]|nr:hypothetical protein [Muribaculaceae bacterium]
MKALRGFIIAMVIFFVCMMVIETLAPRRFNWDVTYAHASDEPFGCELFDSVMSASLKQGYTTSSLTLSQLEKTIPSDERHIYLIIAEDEPFTDTDGKALLNMLKRGDQFLVAAGSWRADTYEEALNLKTDGYAVLNLWALKISYLNKDVDTLTWCDNANGYSKRIWRVEDELVGMASVSQQNRKSKLRPLLVHRYFKEDGYDWDEESEEYVPISGHFVTDTLAGLIPYGKGKIVVSTTPMMFSNYGLLYGDAASLALRFMGQLEQYPVIRLDPAAKTEVAGVSESPLRYVISQPPMKWAMWLLIVTVILAMVFTARRRQRVIPVIAPPVNRALEMVKHIGSLYFQRHDNADLMAKKYQFFVEEVRKLTMIDLDDENHIDDAYLQLQHVSGIPREELKQQLQEIVAATVDPVKDKQLMRHIDYLNKILTKLKN